MLNLFRQASAFLACFAVLIHTAPSYALGLGGLNTKSYIGQPLWVEIPLYNVVAPNELKVNLARVDGESLRGLSAEISRANSQLSILIRSNSVVNEPYFNFELNLDDQGNKFTKQLTVLLNLKPGTSSSNSRPVVPASNRSVVSSSDSAAYSATSRSSTSGSETSNYNPVRQGNSGAASYRDLMGPYDWAQAGAIPEKFGAVLDGQSLWRVARRISPAMNVTNNQMMWALYQANPQAFATSRIESLQAGVFLTIPTEQTVRQVNDSQAKLFLSDLSSYSAPTPSASIPVIEQASVGVSEKNSGSDEVDQESALDGSDQIGSQTASAEQFQLTGLDKRVSAAGLLSGASDDESQEIIGSLAETISSMTEQLGRKDKRIDVLEAQVEELQAFIKQDRSVDQVESFASASPITLTESSASAVEISTSQLAQQERRLFALDKTLVPWLIGFILVVIGWLMRHRFVTFWQTLDFSREKDRVEFQASEMEASGLSVDNPPRRDLGTPDIANSSNYEQVYVEDNETEEVELVSEAEISFQSSESEFSHSEFSLAEYSEVSLAEEYFDSSGTEMHGDQAASFEERFSQLIAEGNSVLARQLLDIAQGNQVASDRYHFHRLQLLSLEEEEDPFYEYYSEMENELPSFSSTVQTDISKLVVKMSQRDL